MKFMFYFFIFLNSVTIARDSDYLYNNWTFINHKQGVKVFKKDTENGIVAFKGEKIIQAPISKLAWVLTDNKHRLDWVDRLIKIKELEKNRTLTRGIVYQVFDLPFPFNHRYYILEGTLKVESIEEKVVTLSLKSIDSHPGISDVEGVEARLYHSKYTLSALSPYTTKVEVEIHTNPQGYIPRWVVNLVQKKWPLETLLALEIQVLKPFVLEHNYIKNKLGQY